MRLLLVIRLKVMLAYELGYTVDAWLYPTTDQET